MNGLEALEIILKNEPRVCASCGEISCDGCKKVLATRQLDKELRDYNKIIKALDLKQPIFVKDFQGVCKFDDTIVSSRFITNGNQLMLVDDFSRESMYINLNEYGEAWAFSEEELKC